MGMGLLMKVLNELTDQELFDIAYDGVVGQGKACYYVCDNAGIVCEYREEEQMCAAGHILAECYPPEWPGWNFFGNFDELVRSHGLIISEDSRKLVMTLQEAHDENCTSTNYLEDYKSRMSQIAKDNCLKFPEE